MKWATIATLLTLSTWLVGCQSVPKSADTKLEQDYKMKAYRQGSGIIVEVIDPSGEKLAVYYELIE